MSDMNDSPDQHAFGSSLRRREFLTKAAAAGAITWAAPVILSRSAYAADGVGGTPGCQPTISGFSCVLYDCMGGNKQFPGFTFNPNGLICPCSNTTPPQRATTCIKITPIPPATTFTCGGDPVVAYGAGTDCSPRKQGDPPDVILNTGNWECFNTSNLPVFFGRARAGGSGGGAIPNLASCDLSFRVAIWAGKCPDADSPDDAFTCQTFIVKICYNSSGTGSVTCTPTATCPGGGFTTAPAAQSLCTTTPADLPPCCPPVKPVGPNQACCT